MRPLTAPLLLLLLTLTLNACGGGDTGPGDAFTFEDVMLVGDGDQSDAGAEDLFVTGDTGDAAALCERIWQRLNDCGLYYTFPEFPADCASWRADGDSERLGTLATCAVYACNRLRQCVEAL